MDAYQRLIEDLPGRLPPGHSRRASEKAMREAAAGLPLANPAQATVEVERLLDEMLATTWAGGERIAALAHLDAPVESLCLGVEQQLSVEAHPLPPASAERAATAQRLEWELACNYAIGLHELCAPAGKLPMFKGKLAAVALVAGLVHANQALLWAYRQYQSPPPGVWRLMHALHAFACEAGLVDQDADDPCGGQLSPRAAYAHALLLALGNPYRFSARELKEAGAAIHCVAGHCRFTRAGTHGVTIDTDIDAGPGYVAEERATAGAGMLAMDVQSVARIFDERIALLPPGVDVVALPRPGGGTQETSARFLRRLQAGWAPAERGHQRLSASHVLDVAAGMHAVHYVLSGNLDFATFIRQVHGEAITVGQHELGSAWMASSDSTRPQILRGDVLDQSEGGYRLRLQEPDGARLRIGEVIALAPLADASDERDWMVGVIRWLRLEGSHEWLGVELMHRTARAAGLRMLTVSGEAQVPQRAVELPDPDNPGTLSLLVSNVFARNVASAEVVLPPLASDWRDGASVAVWRCTGTDILGNACVRVTLVRDTPVAVGASGTEA